MVGTEASLPLVTWEVGEGRSGCRFRVEPALECRELARQTQEGCKEPVWKSDHPVQQLPPLPSKEKGQETVKVNVRCAFPDRLCLILPPRSNRPSAPAFLFFLSTPLPLSYY